jgi:hypothetical protein
VALPKELGAGGTGLHGDQAIRLRPILSGASDVVAVIEDLVALVNETRDAHNALLAQLDADAGVTDTNYVATHTVAAPAVVYPPA